MANQYTKAREEEAAKERLLKQSVVNNMKQQYSLDNHDAFESVPGQQFLVTAIPFFKDPVIVVNALVGLNQILSIFNVGLLNLIFPGQPMEAQSAAAIISAVSAIITIILKTFFSKNVVTLHA